MCKSKSKTYTTSELASILSVSPSTITRFAQKHNISPVQITKNNAKHYYINDFQSLDKQRKVTGKTKEKPKKHTLVEQLNLRISDQQARINELNKTIELLSKQLTVKDRQIEVANKLIDQAQQLDLTTHQQTQQPIEQPSKSNEAHNTQKRDKTPTTHGFWYNLFHGTGE